MVKRVKTLDYYVRRALCFFRDNRVKPLRLPRSKHTLVIGSQSAYLAGRILYRFSNRVFSHAPEVLARCEIDRKYSILGDVAIVSASGTRDVCRIADYALSKGLRVNAIVCTSESELHHNFSTHERYREIIVPAIKEPPTVNTATCGRMVQAVTREDPAVILRTVRTLREPARPYRSFRPSQLYFLTRCLKWEQWLIEN